MRTRALSAVAALALGCPSTAMFRSAEPVPAGRWQASLAAGAGALADRETGARSPTGYGALGLQRGLTDDVDVGVRLYTVGLSALATVRFVHRGSWSVALAPELSVARTPSTSTTTNAFHLFAAATVPVTYRASRTWALSAGPSLGAGLYLPEAGGRAGGAWLGAFVNAEARLGERWWLVPELSGYTVFAGDVPLRGGMFTAGLGLRFGF